MIMSDEEEEHDDGWLFKDDSKPKESDTEDDLEDDELSDDEKYIDARKHILEYKNQRKAEKLVDTRAISYSAQNQINKWNVVEGVDDEDTGLGSDYAASDGDVNSLCTSEEEEMEMVDVSERKREKREKRRVVYDPTRDHKILEFTVGMRFEVSHQCKLVVQRHSILNGRNI
ncbi:hypothetical protein ACS0TY_032164 [Phlomoides rotata]